MGRAALAAIVEESAKLLIVIAVALIFRSHFNDPIDGLIYGAFAGLGGGRRRILLLHRTFRCKRRGLRGRKAVRLLLHLLMGGPGRVRSRLGAVSVTALEKGATRLVHHFDGDPFLLGTALAASLTPARRRWHGSELRAIGLMFFCDGAVWLFGHLGRPLVACDCTPPKSLKRLWGWPFSLLFRRNR